MNPFRTIRGESPECESTFGSVRLAPVSEKSVYMDIAKSALFKQILPAIGQFFFGLKVKFNNSEIKCYKNHLTFSSFLSVFALSVNLLITT